MAIWYGDQRLIHRVSLEGVVNAPIIMLRSPIDGNVVTSLAQPDLTLTEAADLFRIENPRVSEEIHALDQHIAQLTVLRDELTKRVEEHRTATLDHLDASISELEAALASARSTLMQAEDDENRTQQLARSGLASQRQVEQSRDALRRAQADVERATASLARARADRAAAERGIIVGEGYGDVPYSQQRIDEIRLTLAGLAQQRVELSQSLAATISVPSGAVVRAVDVRAGSQIVRDDLLAEIIDCSHSYVEASLPERAFDIVQPGSTASVKLRGNSMELSAIVRMVRGAGVAKQLAAQSAAILERSSQDAMTVLLDLNPTEFRKFSGGRCQVGRQATVVFE